MKFSTGKLAHMKYLNNFFQNKNSSTDIKTNIKTNENLITVKPIHFSLNYQSLK